MHEFTIKVSFNNILPCENALNCKHAIFIPLSFKNHREQKKKKFIKRIKHFLEEKNNNNNNNNNVKTHSKSKSISITKKE